MNGEFFALSAANASVRARNRQTNRDNRRGYNRLSYALEVIQNWLRYAGYVTH